MGPRGCVSQAFALRPQSKPLLGLRGRFICAPWRMLENVGRLKLSPSPTLRNSVLTVLLPAGQHCCA